MRVVVASGPGVPIVVEEHAGMVSLKTTLLPLLDRVEEAVGKGEVRRLTVFDAEMATGRIIAALSADPTRSFVTLLKGPLRKAVAIDVVGEWGDYRERDQVREVMVRVPKRLEGVEQDLTVRGVELRRPSSRHEYSSVYLTGEPTTELSTTEVVTAYLSRWPHQEQLFRDSRNGGGLNRSHGYGGEYITNVALPTRQDKAAQRVVRAERKLTDIESELETAEATANANPKEPGARAVHSLAKRAQRAAKRDLDRAKAVNKKLEATPREIYARDLTRDSIMTCLKLTVLMLIKFMFRTYFGGLRMEYRTFIEKFVALPVTVRTSKTRVHHQFHANLRDIRSMRQLEDACAVLNRRRLRRGKRLLTYEVIGLPPPES